MSPPTVLPAFDGSLSFCWQLQLSQGTSYWLLYALMPRKRCWSFPRFGSLSAACYLSGRWSTGRRVILTTLPPSLWSLPNLCPPPMAHLPWSGALHGPKMEPHGICEAGLREPSATLPFLSQSSTDPLSCPVQCNYSEIRAAAQGGVSLGFAGHVVSVLLESISSVRLGVTGSAIGRIWETSASLLSLCWFTIPCCAAACQSCIVNT